MHRFKWVLIFSFLAVCSLYGQTEKSYLNETKDARDARMEWWRDARFGMFIHWGLYAVPAGEYKGQKVKGIGEWIQASLNIPRQEYEEFAPQFNPVKYDPDEWARLASEAGMKYLVITSKHHDGFCLWDSKVTDYDVVDATPYGKELLPPLVDACRRHGVRPAFYYSILDWHHPSQYVDPDAKSPRAGHARNKIYEEKRAEYINYMKAQLEELVTRFDPAVLWFDGEWTPWYSAEEGRELYNYLRNLKPDLIINNRIGKGRQGMSGLDKGEGAVGDFGTPEQEIPATGVAGVDWESCMTMNDTWGYKYFDGNWKSTETLLQNLIDIVSKGGNYLLNVGPTAEGLIPQPSVHRLNAMGDWLDKYGESIYETTASPYERPQWGRYTEKPGYLYVHIFDWPENNTLEIPLGVDKIQEVGVLSDYDEHKLYFEQSSKGTQIKLPPTPPDEFSSVVVVKYKRN
ncbi:alpha-L-fucosidase [candidate division KSB1 bacterium]|nr:alpha-L-fucosidase [candidate division KSB1 bacterium]